MPPSSGRTVPVPATHAQASSCKGKAPPFDTFSGEDPVVCVDDWVSSLQRASTWNDWTEEEELIQLVGSLRGHTLWEWTLLPDTDRSNMKSGIVAICNRLESGVNGYPGLPDTVHRGRRRESLISFAD